MGRTSFSSSIFIVSLDSYASLSCFLRTLFLFLVLCLCFLFFLFLFIFCNLINEKKVVVILIIENEIIGDKEGK